LTPLGSGGHGTVLLGLPTNIEPETPCLQITPAGILNSNKFFMVAEDANQTSKK
jgi:hypothetical protein